MELLTIKSLEKHQKNLREINELKQTKDALLTYRNELPPNEATLISELSADIVSLENKISQKSSDIIKSGKAVQNSISFIQDEVTATVARLHYVSGLTWTEIAYKLHLGSEKNVKERFYRHYRKTLLNEKGQ